MNENLNLVKLLKDCPEGTKFYSTIYGYVTFVCIDENNPLHPVRFNIGRVTAKGYHYCDFEDAECTFFPSKDQRDWSKWVCPKPDLPVDTPVVVENSGWCIGFYAGNGRVRAYKNTSYAIKGNCIIPYEKFNPNDIEESLKYNIVNDERK